MRSLNLREKLDLGKRLLVEYRSLKKAPVMSADERQARQFSQISALIQHAYTHVPFYQTLYNEAGFSPADLKDWDAFEQLPLVTKDQLIANYPENILDPRIKRDDLIISRSSGSSGKVVDIAYDETAFLTYVLAGLRLYRMGFAYRPWHRQTYIYTSTYPMESLFGLYPLRFLHTLTPVDETIADLTNAPPDLLVCYPSHLRSIADALRSSGKTLQPRFISVNSEMSTQAERDQLSAFFGCPVLDEYSSEELTRIAAQCTHGTYHLFEDINYMEAVDDNDQITSARGRLVGTNLHNTAMPMIRYLQDDLGRISEDSCACGWRFRHLKELEGRRNDSFTMPSGKELTSGLLLDASYEILLAHDNAIRDFCLIQWSLKDCELEVVPGEAWSDEIKGAVHKALKEQFEPSVKLLISVVDSCTKSKSGKRNPIINMMKRHNKNG